MPHCCICKPGIFVRQWSLLLSIGDLVLYNYVWISVHYYWDTSILYYMTVLVGQYSLLLRHVYLVLYDCTCRSVFTTTETRLSILYYMTVLVGQYSLLLRHVYLVLYDCTCRSALTTTETRLSCIIWLYL
jgi:hypothetical protein